MKFETVWIQFLADVFSLLSSRNFATMATWREDFSYLLSPEERRPDGLPRTQALLGILCGNRGRGGHEKRVWLFTASLPLWLCLINASYDPRAATTVENPTRSALVLGSLMDSPVESFSSPISCTHCIFANSAITNANFSSMTRTSPPPIPLVAWL